MGLNAAVTSQEYFVDSQGMWSSNFRRRIDSYVIHGLTTLMNGMTDLTKEFGNWIAYSQ